MGMRLDLFSHVPRLNFLRLRPYGENLATPAVTVWLAPGARLARGAD